MTNRKDKRRKRRRTKTTAEWRPWRRQATATPLADIRAIVLQGRRYAVDGFFVAQTKEP